MSAWLPSIDFFLEELTNPDLIITCSTEGNVSDNFFQEDKDGIENSCRVRATQRENKRYKKLKEELINLGMVLPTFPGEKCVSQLHHLYESVALKQRDVIH